MGVTINGNTATFDGTGTLTKTVVSSGLGSATQVIITGYDSIGDWAFGYCRGLTSISMASVKTINYAAFAYCEGLTSISMDGVTTIGNFSFIVCKGFTSINIPDSVTSIGTKAFLDCGGMTSISIPASVTSIGNYAFQGCSRLKTVYIPNGFFGKTPPATGYFFGSSLVTFLLLIITAPITAPTITDFSIPSKTYGEQQFSITRPISNSTGSFTYTSSNLSVATINGSTITITGIGETTITATQAATATYFSGTIQTKFTVAPATPSIGNFSIPSKTYGDAPFPITQPTSNSTGLFTYISGNSSVATINGSTITIVGPGQATITATQAATPNYFSGTIQTTLLVNQSTPTNPVILSSEYELLYFLTTSARYATLTQTMEIKSVVNLTGVYTFV